MPKVILAEKYTGMMISMSGILRRKLSKFEADTILGHLNEMGKGYYSGNTAIVDEFLQLYRIAEDLRDGCVKSQKEVNNA